MQIKYVSCFIDIQFCFLSGQTFGDDFHKQPFFEHIFKNCLKGFKSEIKDIMANYKVKDMLKYIVMETTGILIKDINEKYAYEIYDK